jgi:hypothetical protein
MSLADVIDNFATGSYVVRRSGAVTWVHGVATPAVGSSFNITALVTPLGGKELMRLPEGDRDKERLVVITKTELRSVGTGGKPDVVEIGSASYEVSSVEAWSMFGFWKATVTRVAR